jgi:competence protein ComEA
MLQKIKEYISKNKNQLLNFSFIINIASVIFIILIYINQKEKNVISIESDNSDIVNISVSKDAGVFVEILGQVVNPGVYLVDSTTMVIELLAKAGGATEYADMEYIHKNIPLSKFLILNQKIYIPSKNEKMSSNSEGSIININNSTKSDIETLPGIGEITAQKIIDNRPYFQLIDLVNRKILSENIYNKIVTLVTL